PLKHHDDASNRLLDDDRRVPRQRRWIDDAVRHEWIRAASPAAEHRSREIESTLWRDVAGDDDRGVVRDVIPLLDRLHLRRRRRLDNAPFTERILPTPFGRPERLAHGAAESE